MLHPLLGRSRRFAAWQHYPRHDAVDASGRWQFYFHAHEAGDPAGARHPQERGHIHLFRRHPDGRLSHLAGLSLDARGTPLLWFAPNQWVTGERWLAADRLLPDLAELELKLRGPLAGVAAWLAELVRFYAPPLRDMLRERDAALARYCAAHGVGRPAARSARGVAVWSSFPVSWPQDALQAAGQISDSSQARSAT